MVGGTSWVGHLAPPPATARLAKGGASSAGRQAPKAAPSPTTGSPFLYLATAPSPTSRPRASAGYPSPTSGCPLSQLAAGGGHRRCLLSHHRLPPLPACGQRPPQATPPPTISKLRQPCRVHMLTLQASNGPTEPTF